MPTFTALQPRPYVIPREVAEIELVPALPEDLKVFSIEHEKYVLRQGMLFWLKSSITGKIEGSPHVISELTNVEDLNTWLQCNMVYIAKNPFE